MDVTASLFAALGIGLALASTPGPVQAVIIAESLRGGVGRGLRVTAGAALTFLTLLVALALGVSAVALGGVALRALQVLGGALLLWLALDAFRSAAAPGEASGAAGGLSPMARGSLSVLLNPGAWLFLAAVAAPLLASAAQAGGRGAALLTAVAMEGGTAAGDLAFAILAGAGLRRIGGESLRWVQRGLALVLALLGAWLLVQGLLG